MGKNVAPNSVTLVIYGWDESQPGTLAWVFPSVSAALRGVRAMRNAARWIILRGGRAFERDAEVDLIALRSAGAVLLERLA